MTLQEAHNFLFEPLLYCGCGDPQAILEKIQACLEYAENWQAQGLEWSRVVEQLFAGETAAAYLVFCRRRGLGGHLGLRRPAADRPKRKKTIATHCRTPGGGVCRARSSFTLISFHL